MDNFVGCGLTERFATVAHLLLKLEGLARAALHDLADDIPGGLGGVVETLRPTSIVRHAFPKCFHQFSLPSYSSFLFNLIPHRCN